MMDGEPDPTLDRLLRHMAWANAQVLATLAALPGSALRHSPPGSDWTVADIVDHLVMAAGGYASRLDGEPWPPRDTTPPVSGADVAMLADLCARYDARLRAAAVVPEGDVVYEREGRMIRRARSTVLAQSIHHATEHRAQIAGGLAAHGIRAVDLDDLDLWAYGTAEGLGA